MIERILDLDRTGTGTAEDILDDLFCQQHCMYLHIQRLLLIDYFAMQQDSAGKRALDDFRLLL